MPKFGETPNHEQDKCATCANLIDIKGIRFKEHVRTCRSLGSKYTVPAVVTSCSLYQRQNTQSLHEMYEMAWVLTLDQKKRDIGFRPPKEKDRDDDDRMWEAARKLE